MGTPERYDWPAILDWIWRHYQETGWPVTVREIMREWRISSSSVVWSHLRHWVAQGLLKQQGGKKPGFKPPHKESIL